MQSLSPPPRPPPSLSDLSAHHRIIISIHLPDHSTAITTTIPLSILQTRGVVAPVRHSLVTITTDTSRTEGRRSAVHNVPRFIPVPNLFSHLTQWAKALANPDFFSAQTSNRIIQSQLVITTVQGSLCFRFFFF